MKLYIVLGIILILLLIVSLIEYKIFRKKIEQEREKIIKKELAKAEQQLKETEKIFVQKIKELEQVYKDKEQDLQRHLKEKEQFVESAKLHLDKELEERTKLSKEKIKHQEELVIIESEQKINDQINTLQEKANESLQTALEAFDYEIDIARNALVELKQQINEYSTKRDAINQAILREKEIEEKTDFYRICLSEEAINDIKLLKDIKEKLACRDKIDKVIYDNYISKSVLEMERRVLAGREPCGIYKITCIPTGEIYIGKSTNIKTRWQNHIKGACGLDGIADSIFQRALKKYGIEHFTFEVLEEVDKDKLSEREAYYIKFYDSATYGFNQRKEK